MKKSFMILGIAAAAVAMVSCNKSEELKLNNENYFEGDKAYIVVNINDVGSSATRATDGGFAYGTSDEHTINDVHFCFYDADGFFVTAASAGALSGTASTDEPAVNVEFQSNTVVVLEHLAHTTYPSYVVTVINAPEASFTAPNTLNDFVELIATAGAEGIQNTGFAMSTSSYGTSTYYFATPVTTENFALEPIEYGPDGVTPTNCEPVYIYVERLAAKVEVAVDPNSDMTAKTTTINGVTAYQLDSIDLDGDGEAEQAIYVTLDGWAVNATSRESYLMKEIDPAWDFGTWVWNDAANFRSYWGMSTAYGYGLGTGDFPTSSNGNTDYDETVASTELSQYLKYTSLNNPLAFSTYTYCAENTNTASAGSGVIQSKNSSAVTAVLVAATVVDENGEGLSLIKHSGILYTPESYMNYALGHIAQYWYRIPDDEVDNEEVYLQISTDIIEFKDVYDGYVVIGVKEGITEDETVEGYYVFYTSTDGENFEDSSLSALEGSIATFIATYGDDANYYNGGLMYYNVPIEHLNNGTATDTDGNSLIVEGNYGVVRNHWYQITINDIAGLGKGIYNPEEVIIPGLETELYYIGANINILSWKVVEQGVTLQ